MSTLNIPFLYRRTKRHPFIISICLLTWQITLSSSNYPYLEQIYMVQKMFELLRFDLNIITLFHSIHTENSIRGSQRNISLTTSYLQLVRKATFPGIICQNTNLPVHAIYCLSFCMCTLMHPFSWNHQQKSGPSCSKLTMSLVNVSLKIWSLNVAYTHVFCWKIAKATHIFQQKYLWIRYTY